MTDAQRLSDACRGMRLVVDDVRSAGAPQRLIDRCASLSQALERALATTTKGDSR